MGKTAPTPGPAEVQALTSFCVGVRTINAGEIFPADDPAVVAEPDRFGPVEDLEG
jgi:hypothetical protein